MPHRFPFRFLDGAADDPVRVRLTTGSAWCRGGTALPSVLAIEILAQAAVLALPEPEAGREEAGTGWLAGVNDARFEAPLVPGMTLEARLSLEGRLGRVIKARGELTCAASGATVAAASLLLALG